MAMNFTPDQQRVIDTRNSNILVSAAAGSGKTAVLVERIIQMITDEKKPVDIDRLLIVTFTSAAAAQMRERISRAVSQRLEENPESEHLQKQASLIHNALITTIDSFCLFVIRNNFNEIGLDPAFRVADESEVKMLEADVMGRLLEQAHTEPTERFLHFVESYSTGTNEKKIEEAILRLYHFSMSYPFPEEWLTERLEDYRVSDVSELPGKKWFQSALSYIRTILQECRDRLYQALGIAGGAGGPIQYSENLTADIELIERLRCTSDYDELYDLFTYSSFGRLSAKKVEGVDPALKEMVKAIRDEVKKNVADLKRFLFQISVEDTLNDMAACQEVVEELVSLTCTFKQMLDQTKRDKNVIDFSDMEHFALQILLKKDGDGNIVPANTALELQDYFEEIMIDEYQDSNEVQELLLKCISGEDKGRFNRFMVGDVKQSIYKFRLARPEIFMEKYDTYVINDANAAQNGMAKNVRIDLSMNFRSRREVTDSTNFICSQLMTAKVGNVEYDDRAALYVGASYPEPDGKGEDDIYRTELLIATPESLLAQSAAENDDTPKYSEKETEAVMVAERIRQIVGKFPVTDAATGEVRPAKYSDIVLLFRATAGWDEDFRRILSERGIPVHVTSRAGYFETLEIQGIVNFLRVLDNPLQDVPLFGVLKLPYFDFSETEITEIRCFARDFLERQAQDKNEKKKLFLYEQLKLYYNTVCCVRSSDIEGEIKIDADKTFVHEDYESTHKDSVGVIRAKLERFLSMIAKYRRKVAYTPIKELLQQLIADTSYDAYVGSMPGGDQRIANIGLLLEKAGAFQNTSFYGLFHFIRYLETIQEQEVDFGEANILDENADVVRIMTIHKSKGLEFPVCFVGGLSKQFNQMDMRQSILMDVELGIGVDYVDPMLRLKRKTMRKNVVAQRMKEDTRGEDLRVLYVALTRAKEKLILTGFTSDFDRKLANNMYLTMESSEKLPYSVMMGAVSYMDMILASLMRHPCMREILEEKGFSHARHHLPYMDIPIGIELYQEAQNLTEKLKMQVRQQGRAVILEEELARMAASRDHAERSDTKAGGAEIPSQEAADDQKLKTKLYEKLHFIYPHKDLEGLTVKTTVSELKKASYEEAFAESEELIMMPKEHYIPAFAAELHKNMTDVSENAASDETADMSEYRGSDQTKDSPAAAVGHLARAQSGIQYGTAVHKVMELLSFSEKLRVEKADGAGHADEERTRKRLYAILKSEQEQWLAEGNATREELACVSMNKMICFFQSALSQRMIAANQRAELFKEQPFVLGISADRLKPSFPPTETVLIQGVIDVFFYEKDEIVLADYKTDKVSCREELIRRYRTQLDYYQMALEQITGKKVKERYLYSFYLQEEIRI